MKRNLIILLFLFSSHFFWGQDIFKKFENQNQVASETINKKMLELMGKVKIDASDTETKNYLEVIKKLDYLKFCSTNNLKIAGEMKLEFEKFSKNLQLIEIMNATDGAEKIKAVTDNSSEVKNIYMLIQNESKSSESSSMILHLKGSVTTSELRIITKKLHLKGK